MRTTRFSETVTDVYTALGLLIHKWNDRTKRYLDCHDRNSPVIVVNSYGGHYDQLIHSKEYPVTPEVVRELVSRRWVEGTPMLGYTDNSRLSVTRLGEEDDRHRQSSDEKLADCLRKMLDTGFDYLIEIQRRGETCRIMTTRPDPQPEFPSGLLDELVERGFIELLEEATMSDGGKAYRCQVTEAGHRHLTRA